MPEKYPNVMDQLLKNSRKVGSCIETTYKCKRPSKCPQMTRNGKCITISRACWEYHYGKIPEGLFVCHHCDNPRCFNIEHLFLGTPRDNNHDMIKKGRDNNFGAKKYDQKKMQEAIRLRQAGFTYKQISEKINARFEAISAYLIRRKIMKGVLHEPF